MTKKPTVRGEGATQPRVTSAARLPPPQERLMEMKAQAKFALSVAAKKKRRPNASVELSAGQIYETLQDFEVNDLKECLKKDPEMYTKIVAAIARLSQADLQQRKLELELRKYRDQVAEQKARLKCELRKGQGGVSEPGMDDIIRQIGLL